MAKTDSKPKPVPAAMKNCMRRGCEKSCREKYIMCFDCWGLVPKATREKYIMCFDCWGLVPKATRDRVWRASRGGDRRERIAAVRAAIESLPKTETPIP